MKISLNFSRLTRLSKNEKTAKDNMITVLRCYFLPHDFQKILHDFCEILMEYFSKVVEYFPKVGFRGKTFFLENFKTYSPYSPAKRETPVYKGFPGGSSSRDTHPGSHPGTHHLGEFEVRPNEPRPKITVVQVTNWVSVWVSIRVSVF